MTRTDKIAIVISLASIALSSYAMWRHSHPPEYAGEPQTYPGLVVHAAGSHGNLVWVEGWEPKLVYHEPRALTPQEWQDTMDDMCRHYDACYPESMRVAPSKPLSFDGRWPAVDWEHPPRLASEPPEPIKWQTHDEMCAPGGSLYGDWRCGAYEYLLGKRR